MCTDNRDNCLPIENAVNLSTLYQTLNENLPISSVPPLQSFAIDPTLAMASLQANAVTDTAERKQKSENMFVLVFGPHTLLAAVCNTNVYSYKVLMGLISFQQYFSLIYNKGQVTYPCSWGS